MRLPTGGLIDRDTHAPDGTDLEVYAKLVSVVKEASRDNVAQAGLKATIMELGSVAVTIAKKGPEARGPVLAARAGSRAAYLSPG